MNQYPAKRCRPGKLSAVFIGIGLLASAFIAHASAAISAAANPNFQDIGAANPASRVSATLTLKSSKSADLESAIAGLYEPSSPTYHQWMSSAQVASFGPSQQDVATARASLNAMGLSIDHQSDDGTTLRVSGTADQVQAAFGTTLHQVKLNGRMALNATSKPVYRGAHAELVAGVGGLTAVQMKPLAAPQIDLSTGLPMAGIVPQAGTDPLASFTSNCFKRNVSINAGYMLGHGPIEAAYTGPGYLDITTPDHARCGYTAKDIVSHYGMQEAHALGWTGKGQTIVIVDAYGSPTIEADLRTFSQVMGIRPVSGKDFKVVYSDGQPATQDTGWATETTLDVEWAHALAPDAKIVLVVAPTALDADLSYAVLFAVDHHLGEVVSNSWGNPEASGTSDQATMFNAITRSAAARGVAVNFAAGDSGDNGVGSPLGAALMPADSPYVTAIGGTSIDIPSDAGPQETAWGLSMSLLAGSTGVAAKPIPTAFQGGGGGGESIFFSKPPYQRSLPGSGRQTPDIAALANPATGAIIVQTDPATGQPTYAVYGGTSLATPIFSAIWSIANQAAGESLGQAAPMLSKLPNYAISDVRPIRADKHEVTGSVTYNGVTTQFAPDEVLGFAANQPHDYASALTYSRVGGLSGVGFSNYYAIAFGVDTSLVATAGWDNATGYGVPNGILFIDAVRQFARQLR